MLGTKKTVRVQRGSLSLERDGGTARCVCKNSLGVKLVSNGDSVGRAKTNLILGIGGSLPVPLAHGGRNPYERV